MPYSLPSDTRYILYEETDLTLLIEYQKDKRDLIDHIPEWKREQEEQQRIATEKAEYERQMKQELHSQGADTERTANR